MKKFFYLPALLLAFSRAAFAQAPATPLPPPGPPLPVPAAAHEYGRDTVIWNTSVALMPLSFFIDGLEVAVETRIPQSNTTLRFNAGGFFSANPYFASTYTDYAAFRVEAQLRFHLMRHAYARNGVYLGPYVMYKDASFKGKSQYYSGYYNGEVKVQSGAFGAGVVFGFETRYSSRLLIDFYLGGGLVVPTNSSSAYVLDDIYGFLNPYQRGITGHFGFGFGILPKVKKRPAGY